jgi:hypothetical protein
LLLCWRRLVGYVRATRIQYWIDFCQKSNFDDRPTPTRPDEVDFASLSSKELSRFLEITPLCSDPVEHLY